MNEVQLKSKFTMFAVFWWIGVPLTFVLVGLPFLITSVVFGAIILHAGWKDVQRPGIVTTPGKAVGYCFIPFFNFYWWFVCFGGLADEYNKKLTETGSSVRISKGLAIANCVLNIVGIIPYVGIACAIALMITEFIWMQQLRDAMMVLRTHKHDK